MVISLSYRRRYDCERTRKFFIDHNPGNWMFAMRNVNVTVDFYVMLKYRNNILEERRAKMRSLCTKLLDQICRPGAVTYYRASFGDEWII